ncbi:MAG: ParM/StbA family protein [Turicibacter sp.]|nr:ParM/StbA family protein [Turicibacter sp.]
MEMNNEKNQLIALDLGRGQVKGRTVVEGAEKLVLFPSVICVPTDQGLGADENRTHFSVKGLELAEAEGGYFVGKSAVSSDTVQQYTNDSKTNKISQILLASALGMLASQTKVNVMLGVPKNMYTKTTMEEIKETYEGKDIFITNEANGETKKVNINNIHIFREADASAMHLINQKPRLHNVDFAVANLGFRTLEMTYYKAGFKPDANLTTNLHFGNLQILKQVKDLTVSRLKEQAIDQSKNEKYFEAKIKAYENASEKLETEIEEVWGSQDVEIFVTGGTSKHIKTKYEKIHDPQFSTVRGLYLAGQKKFSKGA